MMSASSLILGFLLNFALAFIIVRFIYYPAKANKNYVFTFLAFSSIIFLVMSLLSRIELSVGLGFGLFAVFSVLRYRTNTIPAREMTYLFIFVALPLINSALLSSQSWLLCLLSNALLMLMLFFLEKGWGFHYEQSKRISYDRIDLIAPQKRELLLADLQERTGLTIKRVDIGRLDFLKDAAELKIYFDDPKGSSQGNWDEDMTSDLLDI